MKRSDVAGIDYPTEEEWRHSMIGMLKAHSNDIGNHDAYLFWAAVEEEDSKTAEKYRAARKKLEEAAKLLVAAAEILTIEHGR